MKILKPKTVIEGAGVKISRSFPKPDFDHIDPFLLFDHFVSLNSDDYIAGFPMHPHRGIETVTYMISGQITHRDSLGNEGIIGDGDVQWMTAGRGIMHEEMPEHIEGKMEGFQIWLNLPAKFKMISPRYQEISSNKIPIIKPKEGVTIKVIAGKYNTAMGSVTDIYTNPVYLDITIAADCEFTIPFTPNGHNLCMYLFQGSAMHLTLSIAQPAMVIPAPNEQITWKAGVNGVRLLLMSAKTINEPIARYGPFVMNTEEEIRQTVAEVRSGTFARH